MISTTFDGFESFSTDRWGSKNVSGFRRIPTLWIRMDFNGCGRIWGDLDGSGWFWNGFERVWLDLDGFERILTNRDGFEWI